jgi:hypothetical protein
MRRHRRQPAAVRRAIKIAIEMHLEGIREDGLSIPKPISKVIQVEVSGRRSSARRKKSAA